MEEIGLICIVLCVYLHARVYVVGQNTQSVQDCYGSQSSYPKCEEYNANPAPIDNHQLQFWVGNDKYKCGSNITITGSETVAFSFKNLWVYDSDTNQFMLYKVYKAWCSSKTKPEFVFSNENSNETFEFFSISLDDRYKGEWICKVLINNNSGKSKGVSCCYKGQKYQRHDCTLKINVDSPPMNDPSMSNPPYENPIPPCSDVSKDLPQTDRIIFFWDGSSNDCGDQMNINEAESKFMSFHVNATSRAIYHAWCMNSRSREINNFTLVNDFSGLMNVFGDQRNAGLWNCVFLTEKNVPYPNQPGLCSHTDKKLYIRINCNFYTYVSHKPTPPITSSPTTTTTTERSMIKSTTPPPLPRDHEEPIYTRPATNTNYRPTPPITQSPPTTTTTEQTTTKSTSPTSSQRSLKTTKTTQRPLTTTKTTLRQFTKTTTQKMLPLEVYPAPLSFNTTTDKPSPEGTSPFLQYGLIGVGVAFGFAIIICAVFTVYKKPKNGLQQRSSVVYQNLSNKSSESLPPFPPGPKLEETYLSPVDCHETPHAPGNPEGTYSLPYKAKLEDLYTKPVPKSKRFDPNTLYTQVIPKYSRNAKPNTEAAYAEVQKKTCARNEYGNENDGNYAQIEKKTKNKRDNDYGNATYAKVQEKTVYAQIEKTKKEQDNDYENNTYAEVQKKTDYAQIEKKTKKEQNNDYGNATYAEIQNKTDFQEAYANVSAGDGPYANLGKTALDAKIENDCDYTNEFTNEPYCNSQGNAEDYAEPAVFKGLRLKS